MIATKKLYNRIYDNNGGLHTVMGVMDKITIEHKGSVLEIFYNGNRGAEQISLTIKGPKEYNIKLKDKR